MRIEANVSIANASPTVIIEHNNQVLTFSIAFYRRTSFNREFDVFSHINQYWADQTPQVQQAIFDIYRQIFLAFDEVYVKQSLKEFLQSKVQELFQYHQLETIQEWIAFRALDIRLPASIEEKFVEDIDRNFSPGKTYTAPEYRKLTALALMLRIMIPIWGEYIFSIKQETDNNFKEMLAFQLVDKALTSELPAVAKLMDYIENTITSAGLSKPTAIFKGISTADYPRWMLALISIRCLAVGDIRGTNPDAHLVTFIHMFITNRLSAKDDNGNLKIKEKEIDETMSDDGARASALERYKIKANISVGDIVELEFFLSDPVRVTRHLAPTLSMEEVFKCLEHMKEYEGRPTIPQITLLQWLYRPIVSPDIILYLSEQLIRQLMGIAEAVLWHRNHRYLSILATCHPVRAEKEMVVSPVDSKMRIPEPLIEELDRLFPYKLEQTSKRSPSREVNLAMESIDRITNNFMVYGWRPTTDIEKIESVLGYKTMRFPIKPDIKTDLARLVIEIQTRNYLKAA